MADLLAPLMASADLAEEFADRQLPDGTGPAHQTMADLQARLRRRAEADGALTWQLLLMDAAYAVAVQQDQAVLAVDLARVAGIAIAWQADLTDRADTTAVPDTP